VHIRFHHRGPRLLAILALLSAVAMSCGQAQDRQPFPGLRFDELLSEPLDAQQAAAFIGQSFPPGASGLHVAGESALDTIIVARFDAPRDAVVSWLADLGITEPLKPGYSPFFSSDPPLSEAADWWEAPAADSTETEYSGLYQQVEAKYYSVVVTPLENGLVRVHLGVHNT
jgi:hypothetical protein